MRLFTFGCSQTFYHYPTWADIVGKNFAYFENWGKPAAGNNYILNALHRCNLVNKFMPTDTVLVLWSGLARIDYYQINQWSHRHQEYFSIGAKNSYFSCPEGYQWLSFSWMASALHLLQNVKVNFKMFHWQPLDQDTEPYHLFKPVLDNITFAPFEANPELYPMHSYDLSIAQNNYDRMAGPDWPSLAKILDNSYIHSVTDQFILDEVRDFVTYLHKDQRLNSKVYKVDHHPSPNTHLKWVEKYLPSYKISQSTRSWIENIDQKILAQQPYDFIGKQI